MERQNRDGHERKREGGWKVGREGGREGGKERVYCDGEFEQSYHVAYKNSDRHS